MGSKMTETESRREAKDELIITALATGVSYEKAGEVAGCSGRTVARRMEDAGFSRRVSKRRGGRVVEAAGQLTSLSDEAIGAIRDCLEDEDPRAVTGEALAPGVFMFQLPSDELYLYTDIAPDLEMWPGGPNFPEGLEPKITRALIEARRIWDPRGVEIEYEAQFAAAVNAYLLPDKITAGFGPYKSRLLTHQTHGVPGITYVAHVDPGKTEANYAMSIGHLVWEQGRPHVIVDRIQVWKPSDFEGGTVNYIEVERQLLDLIMAFKISTVVFDRTTP